MAEVIVDSGTRRESNNSLDDFLELGICNPVVANMTQSSALLALIDEPVWFCLKAQPKREHLAAVAVRAPVRIECSLASIALSQNDQQRAVSFVEAMFLATCSQGSPIQRSAEQLKALTEFEEFSVSEIDWQRSRRRPLSRFSHTLVWTRLSPSIPPSKLGNWCTSSRALFSDSR